MKHTYSEKFHDDVYQYTLNNGLNVYLIPKTNFNKTFVTFTTNYGSFEQSFIPIGKDRKVNQPAGIAHFLEHKLFAMPDGTDAFEKLSSFGVNANAFTTFDKTSYLFSGTDNVMPALEYLLDYVQTPYFTPKSVKKEQGIIAEEYQMYQDYPRQRLFYGLLSQLYVKHPINTEILGTLESIHKITANSLYQAYNTFYHPSNMFLTVIGNFDKEKTIQLIKENQDKKGYKKEDPIVRFLPKEPKSIKVAEDTVYMSINMPYVGLGVKLNPSSNLKALYKQELTLELLLSMYFSKSSTLFNDLLKKGIINDSFSFGPIQYKDALSLIMYGMTPKPEELKNELKKALVGLKRRTIDVESFERQKKVMQGTFIQSLNSLENYNLSFMSLIPYGISLFDVPDIIDSIQIDDIKALMYDIKPSQISVLNIFPKKDQ